MVVQQCRFGIVDQCPCGGPRESRADAKASNTNAKWYMVVGSGPTGYDASVAQGAKVFAIDLSTGPGSSNSLVTTYSMGSWDSYIGDMTAFDRDLDYRHDVVYFGRVINDGVPHGEERSIA